MSAITCPGGRLALLLLVIAGLVGDQAAAQTGAGQAPRERARYFCGKGEVVSLEKDTRVIIIKHEPIEGFMEEAMTMRFSAADSDVLEGVSAGDRVRFTLKDTPGHTHLVFIEKIEARK